MSGPSDPNKKRDIIFEVEKPKVKIPQSVQDMVNALLVKTEARMKAADEVVGELLGAPMEIWLHIQNDKVLFSMHGSQTAAPALAKVIIKAVQEYNVENVQMPPKEFVSSRVGESKVMYERYVRFDWPQKKIFTNFTPDEGEAFFGSLAIVVEELQGATIHAKVPTS